MVNDNFYKKRGLHFGVNTDSFFGIGFGLLGDSNPGRLQASFEEFFELLNSYRIRNIEINTEIEQLNPGSLQKFIIPSISAFSSKLPFPLSVSVHLPYLQLNPASPLEEYRQVSVKAVNGVINACRGLDVKKFVIHLTSEFEDSIIKGPENCPFPIRELKNPPGFKIPVPNGLCSFLTVVLKSVLFSDISCICISPIRLMPNFFRKSSGIKPFNPQCPISKQTDMPNSSTIGYK